MAERGLLHVSHLPAFRQYLAERNWLEAKPKGEYEAARFTHASYIPLILFLKSHADHFSVQEKDYSLVRRFLRHIKDETASDPNIADVRRRKTQLKREGW